MSVSHLVVVIGPEPPLRLDRALARDVPEAAHLSRSRLNRLIREGLVTIDGVPVTDPSMRISAGTRVDIVVEQEADYHVVPQDIPLDILYEDEDLVVVDKPAGMVVHPAPGSQDRTLVNALLYHLGDRLSGVGGEKRPGIVHRIDKDTSGLLVVAKTDRAHRGLAAQFEAHSVRRAYRAICHGVPSSADPRLMGLKGVSAEAGGVIRVATELARHKKDRQRQAVVRNGGRRAVTRLKVVEDFLGEAATLECRLETGRTHQIRVHLSYIGNGLIGDPIYGGRRRISEKRLGATVAMAVAEFPRQALHAAELGFDHPVTGDAMLFASDFPEDLQRLESQLRSARMQR